jgi:DNA-binding PadR family transcriptional regulator
MRRGVSWIRILPAVGRPICRRQAASPVRSAHSTYRVLLALADGELRHGYAIMQAVAEMSGGKDSILPGTLYAALARMVDKGSWRRRTPPIRAAPRRRYYRWTAFGRAVARAESERLQALLDIALAQNLTGGGK